MFAYLGFMRQQQIFRNKYEIYIEHEPRILKDFYLHRGVNVTMPTRLD